jgi:hypothetical protein
MPCGRAFQGCCCCCCCYDVVFVAVLVVGIMTTQSLVEVTGREEETFGKMLESFEEHEDVQNVWHNAQ